MRKTHGPGAVSRELGLAYLNFGSIVGQSLPLKPLSRTLADPAPCYSLVGVIVPVSSPKCPIPLNIAVTCAALFPSAAK
jgi:hypothetical protein